MKNADSLGDLSEIMGADYEHGFNADEGDPNVKPNPAPAPVEDISKRSPGTIGLTFPPQKQFLTRLVVQAMPLKDVPKGTAPFSMFATTTAVGGKQVTVENAPSATSCMFHDLMPGSYYAFRLVSTNPHSTTQGIPSAPLLTMPQVPPKLRQSDVASSDCIEIVFPPQGQFLTNMKVHASLYKPGVNPWGEGTYGQFNVGHPTTCKSVVVNRLKPGTKYIFRLETENAAGGAIGETCEPILTLPGQPPAPVEETKLRTDTQLSLKWTALGQYITKLKLQYAIMSGKQTFQKLEGGKEIELENPRNCTGYICKGLTPDKSYVFRLIATNASGDAVGEIGGPVKTVEFAPDQFDKSGYLFLLPKRDGKKTIGRRLSLKKKKPTRFWYVLDGKLLSWYNDVEDTEEVGFIHLGKVKEVTSEFKNSTGVLKLYLKDGKLIELMVESTDPNLSTENLIAQWASSIEGSVLGTTAPRNEEVEQIEAPIIRKGPPPKDPEEETDGFADFALDEVDGFGDFGMADEELGFGEDLGDGEEEFGF